MYPQSRIHNVPVYLYIFRFSWTYPQSKNILYILLWLYNGSIAHCINFSSNREQWKKKQQNHQVFIGFFRQILESQDSMSTIWKLNEYKTMSGSCRKNTTPVFITKDMERVRGRKTRNQANKCCMLKSQ